MGFSGWRIILGGMLLNLVVLNLHLHTHISFAWCCITVSYTTRLWAEPAHPSGSGSLEVGTEVLYKSSACSVLCLLLDAMWLATSQSFHALLPPWQAVTLLKPWWKKRNLSLSCVSQTFCDSHETATNALLFITVLCITQQLFLYFKVSCYI